MKKKIIMTLLALAMASSIAACGGSGASSSTGTTDTTSNSAVESDSASDSISTSETVSDSTAAVSASATSTAESSTSAGSSTGITAEEFNAIEIGMSYEQVKEIIGEDGTESNSSQVGDVTAVIYTWSSDESGTADVMFQNDKVINKSQTGIATSSVTVTMDQYNQVQTGMTYDQVKEIMGGDGAVASESTIANNHSVGYTWSGSSTVSRCTITFTNDAVSSKNQYGLE